MILYPGDVAIDYSSARPDPATVAGLGVRLVVRYISPITNNRKNATVPELKADLDAGLAVALVWEHAQTDAFGGAPRGRQWGPAAAAFAYALGDPPGMTLFAACDTDVTPSTLQTVLDYFAAFKETCAYPIKPYGEESVITACVEAGICDGGWQTRAWSHGRRSPYADVLQEIGLGLYPHLAVLGNIDANTVLRPFNAWSSTTAQPTGETDMGAVRRFVRDDRPDGQWQIWIQDVDDTLTAWSAPINVHPIPWDAYAYGALDVMPFDVLNGLPHEPASRPAGEIGPLHGTWST